MHYAAETGSCSATAYFLSHGVTLLDRNARGDTPLHIAAEHGYYRIAKMMLDTEEGMRALYHEDHQGRIPLHRAVMRGHPRTTQLLLQKGGIFRKCHKGNTPLHTAAQYGQLETCQVLLKLSPALLDQVNFEGVTALHAAAMNNNAEIVEYLLTAGAQILPARDGSYFVCMALERRHHETLKVTIMHTRWSEIWSILDGTPQCVLDGLIRELPSLFGLVMSRSITRSKNEEKGDVEVTYDLSVMQRKKSETDATDNDPMHRVKEAIRPLDTVDTNLLLRHHAGSSHELRGKRRFCTIERHCAGQTSKSTVEAFELQRQRLDYFRDWTNTLELLLYSAAEILLIDTLIDRSLPGRKMLSTLLMFLAWLNFLLQVTHVKYVGIFVVMFLQVFGTVVKCLSVYSIVILCFGFVFHVLLRDPNYKFVLRNATSTVEAMSTSYRQRLSMNQAMTERGQYNYLDVSLFKTLMMMFGEYEHSSTLIHPLLSDPYPDTQNTIAIFLFYIAFLVFVPIIVMNLLIGLAVGDIEEVRKTACEQLLVQQIYWLADLESKFPKFIQKRLAKKKVSLTVQRVAVGRGLYIIH
ncbi:unnamed protein product [Echinostoma caproni]|uniref:Ion transport domain-containing protein n=1 Tax=Echinostoma caproni TaxID=27848 RepID=A0A3P8GZY1_9TREM|nr:unnamed protein product [Echinostoma caproni]